jgi:hypothetical protein
LELPWPALLSNEVDRRLDLTPLELLWTYLSWRVDIDGVDRLLLVRFVTDCYQRLLLKLSDDARDASHGHPHARSEQ